MDKAVAFREKSLKQQSESQKTQSVISKVRDTDAEENGDGDADVDTDGEYEEADERTPFLRARRASNKVGVTREDAPRVLSIDPLAPSSAFDETLRDRLREDAERQQQVDDAVDDEEEEEPLMEGTSGLTRRDSERLLERNWRAPPGKRIAVPVRVEPKVYFAAERTFLVRFSTRSFRCDDNADYHSLEMAAHCNLYWHDRDYSLELRTSRRHSWARQRRAFHSCCTGRNCIFCCNLCLPCAAFAQAPCRRDVLRQIRTVSVVVFLTRCFGDEYWLEDEGDGE